MVKPDIYADRVRLAEALTAARQGRPLPFDLTLAQAVTRIIEAATAAERERCVRYVTECSRYGAGGSRLRSIAESLRSGGDDPR